MLTEIWQIFAQRASCDRVDAVARKQAEDFVSMVAPEILRREREKARELRRSQWWRAQIGPGICYYCKGKFAKEDLTMDHVIPLARGGKTTKKNVVVSCKGCNADKKHWTMAELRLHELKKE